MRLAGTIFRSISVAVLVLLAGLAALASYGAYESLDRGRAYMKINAARFHAVGTFVMEYHGLRKAFPTEAQIQHWASRQGYDSTWVNSISGDRVGGNSVACSAAQPEEGFALPASDTFVLYRWRGEWFDCYSLPSGRNNVVHSLSGNSPAYHIICWLLTFGFLTGAWFVRPKRLKIEPGSMNYGTA
jgi:hypothetical protein